VKISTVADIERFKKYAQQIKNASARDLKRIIKVIEKDLSISVYQANELLTLEQRREVELLMSEINKKKRRKI